MSTENVHHDQAAPGPEPVNADVAFEERDVRAGAIYRYLIALAVCVLLSYGVCVYILRGTVGLATRSDTPPPPVRAELGPNYRELPPEPRLQGVPGHPQDPQLDRRVKFKSDREDLEKSGWIDQNAGVAQIPIEDAMKILAEKGLPGASAPAEKKK
jgi:hypothetical protein